MTTSYQKQKPKKKEWIVAFLQGVMSVLAFFFDPRPAGPPWDDEWDSMPGDEFWGQDI